MCGAVLFFIIQFSPNPTRTSRAEKKTKDLEEQIYDSLRNVRLGSHTFILDDEEEEEEFNDFPPLNQDHHHKIVQFISGRDTRQVTLFTMLDFIWKRMAELTRNKRNIAIQ